MSKVQVRKMKCPHCGTELEMFEDEEICPNPECPSNSTDLRVLIVLGVILCVVAYFVRG